MALPVQKKFIGNNQVDGSKILLGNSEAFRAKNSAGVATEIFKIDENDRFVMFKAPIATVLGTEANSLQAKSQVDASILVETDARIAADSSLSGQITSEATARTNADNTLQSNITSEATARTNADNTLQTNIDTEASARIAGDAAESSARTTAVNAIESAATAETNARTNADNTLQSNIDAEAATRSTNDLTLQSNIDTEASARIAGDSATLASANSYTDTKITALVNGAPEMFDTLKEISDYIATDQSAGTALATAQSNETAARQAADADLQSQIDAEEVVRANADTSLLNAITQETSDRTAADTVLQNQVNALDGRVTTVEDEFDAFGVRIATAEGTIVDHTAAIAVHETRLDTAEPIIADHETRLDTAEPIIADHETRLDTAESSLAAVIVESSSNESRLDSVESAATVLTGRVTTVENTASTNTSEINAVKVRMTTAESDVDALQAADLVLQSNIDLKINLSQKGAANGVATLGSNGKIPTAQLPAIAITNVFVVANMAARAALVVGPNDGEIQEGDVVKVIDSGNGNPLSFIYKDVDGYIELAAGDAVESVNGQTGHVVLTTTEVSEGTNLYFTNARAQASVESRFVGVESAATALDGRVDSAEITVADHETRLDTLENVVAPIWAPTFEKLLDAADITNGYIDFPHLVLANSMEADVDRLAMHEGASRDYTLSTVGGVSRMTFLNQVAVGGTQALESGMTIFGKYQY